jgi:hypothetical protein
LVLKWFEGHELDTAAIGNERMVTRYPFPKMPGFRLLMLLVEVSVCTPLSFAETPWSFAEKEAWEQNIFRYGAGGSLR